MSLRQIAKTKYCGFITSAKSCSANQVYPMSIAEGYQLGDIYSDGTAVMFWHYCGFVYFSGTPTEETLEEVYEQFFSQELERRFVIITDDEEVISYFGKKDDLCVEERIEYASEKQSFVEPGKPDLAIERISADNITRIKGRIIPSFSWDKNEVFLEKGLGYVAVDGDRVAAVAFSSAVSSEEIDIGVETDPDYRKRGLAAAIAGEMCKSIFELGKTPVWAHSAANVASGRTAERIGFKGIKTNSVIRKK